MNDAISNYLANIGSAFILIAALAEQLDIIIFQYEENYLEFPEEIAYRAYLYAAIILLTPIMIFISELAQSNTI